jgi:hypothetical protein
MGAALEQFKESLELASALKKLEREKYPNLPRANQQHFVKGLRGGAAVLLVASFEFFLSKLFEENISKLNAIPPSIDIIKLPNKMKVKIVFDSLQDSMNGPKYVAKKDKVDRINDVLSACKLLIGEHINPSTFSDTNSNPNGDTVKEKFKEVGITDIYTIVRPSFETKWGTAVALTFIEDKLNEIVRTRHVVAHTTDTLHITRKSQNEAFKFLKIFTELLEKELEKHIKQLIISAKK